MDYRSRRQRADDGTDPRAQSASACKAARRRLRKDRGCMKQGAMMLPAIEAMTDPHPIGPSGRSESDRAAQASARQVFRVDRRHRTLPSYCAASGRSRAGRRTRRGAARVVNSTAAEALISAAESNLHPLFIGATYSRGGTVKSSKSAKPSWHGLRWGCTAWLWLLRARIDYSGGSAPAALMVKTPRSFTTRCLHIPARPKDRRGRTVG